ncbi:MAG: NAD(P)/FAD-dependent oxidoreductase, partial [Sulfitobacter sp.]|nr:NAD(P)/FAD-dependent oxidoreductase [Sulfitobacter sp.]
ETDATVALVDRRDRPGGHWIDAYPFVRLHQSSSFYGVPSTDLGQDRKTQRGYNAGLFELASRNEILHYYEDLMERRYLPTGRVHYFPMAEYRDGTIVSRISGAATEVSVRRKIVQAGIMGDMATIPATHTRSFEVDAGVTCIPPNDLPDAAPGHDHFTVLGAGKTAMDTVLWILAQGVSADRITWVRPSDYWLFQRDMIMPHRDFFFSTMGSMVSELESLASAKSVKEHCLNMERIGRWQRLDPDVWPTRFHAAVCSKIEIEALRQVSDVVRLGHVRHLQAERMVLAEGVREASAKTLYIDCTARGGVILNDPEAKVFDGDTINLFMLRPFQPVFSAALIAHLEATVPDEKLRQQASQVTDFFNTPAEALMVQRQGYINQHVWNQVPGIKDWIDSCRLNAGMHVLKGLGPDDAEKMQLLGKIGPLTAAAVENIPKMVGSEEG